MRGPFSQRGGETEAVGDLGTVACDHDAHRPRGQTGNADGGRPPRRRRVRVKKQPQMTRNASVKTSRLLPDLTSSPFSSNRYFSLL